MMDQRGSEAEIVGKIMKERLDKDSAGVKDEASEVYSAIFQSFLPGSIYVEAPSKEHVALACSHFHGVMRHNPELVSVLDATAVLNCGTSRPSLETNSWVRMRRGLYSGDLAFVRQITDRVSVRGDDEDIFFSKVVTINLIPRIDLNRQRKRKRRTQGTTDRPQAEFFDGHAVNSSHEAECKHVTHDEREGLQQDMWKFRRNTFRNGLLETSMAMNALNFKAVTPTPEELQKWLESWDKDIERIAKETLVKLRSEKRLSGLWPGDRVKVMEGWALGRQGKVQSIEGGVGG